MSTKNTISTQPFDTNTNRPAELDELNFSDDEEKSFEDLIPESNEEYEFVDNATQDDLAEDNVTDDDLTPETLIHEDGARSPSEPGGSIPPRRSRTSARGSTRWRTGRVRRGINRNPGN